ncbi:MAG: DUF881 domain-containing protein [Firmicutes bacterium]|nr:DUF881 domain-containing protein [Bacillota bacterium]
MINKKNSIAIITACIILGILLSLQYKTINDLFTTRYLPSQRNNEFASKINDVRKNNKELKEKIDKLEQKIARYEKNASKDNPQIAALRNKLNNYKMFIGKINVKGPGIVINIEVVKNDGYYEISPIVTHYDYIEDVISVLNISGVEAISINDLRYNNFTEILRVGDHLNINGTPLGPPIEIKAIGNPYILNTSLNSEGSPLKYFIKNDKYKVTIKKEKNIIIPEYKKIIEYRYAQPDNNNF